MGQSTDGQICYGYLFEEEYEFPWDNDEKYADGIEDWWREVKGFKPTFYPYTEEGNHKPGVVCEDPCLRAYFVERSAWDKAHPLPVELVNVCSGDYPIWILAVPGSVMRANRGRPEKFDPGKLDVDGDALGALVSFTGLYKLMPVDSCGWYLSSYWG